VAETDKKTLDLIKDVQRKKAEISKIEKPNWKTNCAFVYVEGRLNDAINIHVESDVRNLIKMASFIIEKERFYDIACKELNVEAPEFLWNGFSKQDWLDDIKSRIDKIQIGKKRTKLESLESRLNAIISPELRVELELQAIMDELS
jgi:hypothetical protein